MSARSITVLVSCPALLATVLPSAGNCPNVANYGQSDWDVDGIGDACDPTPFG